MSRPAISLLCLFIATTPFVCLKMELESILYGICTSGSQTATIARVACPSNFSLSSVILTRESLHHLYGLDSSQEGRYLDDQVSSV